uniref:Uncharacterized protein n=1 Tax=Zea mays TaxID=4577 RepID=B7ZZP6_MAIZE|nr:unknown [Zea mays]
MAASPACAPGLISGPTLPPLPVAFRCYWAQKPSSASTSSRRPCRRRFVPVAAASTRTSSAAARGLDADDFRHPLDKQNTLLLRAIPGLNDVGKALLGPVSEQVMVLQNIGTSVLVSPNQLPDLHQLLVEAAKLLNTEAPDLYIRQNPVPNAYTLAINGKNHSLSFTQALWSCLLQGNCRLFWLMSWVTSSAIMVFGSLLPIYSQWEHTLSLVLAWLLASWKSSYTDGYELQS